MVGQLLEIEGSDRDHPAEKPEALSTAAALGDLVDSVLELL